MNQRLIKTMALPALWLAATACTDEKEQDTVNPVIESVTINGEDHDFSVAGEYMNIDAVLSDNEALGEFKMDIHDVFDGHSHKSSTRLSEVKIIPLSGTSQTISEDIMFPKDVTAGPYHAVFRVLDAAGNEGEFVEIAFLLSNGSEPEIEITNPDFDTEVKVARGTTLTIEGLITEDNDLAEIYIVLEEEHEDHKRKSVASAPLYEKDFDLPGAADRMWDFQVDGNVQITIPAHADSGEYVLTVRAQDADGNINIFSGEIYIE